ncbi:adenosine deaminase-like protein isoform X2 [Amborella trichopoda]|uniref:adenosine deaminase-like protein isoform X2 n=1 Tax=Amborella trichopoda TaxID=13333 RepID=UPI0009BDD2F4|nr:adenosine deaminase-like protein isoform X2 [Amborella trichopoda]|eukprot:XP_020531553.1 adenosine deaminase-like protein isoform X2 [Amborella trichopoda]
MEMRKGKNMGEENGDMDWWVSQPKIELHAHLNGSIRNSTLLELARGLGQKMNAVSADIEHVIMKGDRSLPECFRMFDLIHICTTDHGTVTRITKEVVEDFAAENTVYLELRTTPKKNETIGMTKRSYMEAVIDGLKAVEAVEVLFIPSDERTESSKESPLMNDSSKTKKGNQIYVRLLLSIDRRESTDGAMETAQLALEMRKLGVVGIDLSGNPVVGNWLTFLPALNWAREQGLSVTLHCGEVPNPEEVEAMLEFHPQRIGHACFLNEKHWKVLKSSNIPVEICLTSNVRTDSVSSIDYHHFGLGRGEMFQLAEDAIQFAFAEDRVKQDLKKTFTSVRGELSL